MADYYKTTYGSERRRGRSALGALLDVGMLVVSLGVIVLFLTTIIMPSMHPQRSQELSTLGLIAPFTYAAVLLLMLYWIARWRPIMSAVMILMTIIGLFSVSSFYRIELRRSYGEPAAERGEIKIMTYNTRSFIDDNGAKRLDSVAQIIRSINPDIVCFQEMGFSTLTDSLMREAKLLPMPHSVSRSNLSPAIYSRYPIIKAQRIDTMKNFVWADIVVREDTIRVFNNHLHSTAIRKEDGVYLEEHQYLEDENPQQEVMSMVSRLTENNIIRAAQVDTLVEMVAASPYPAIVCGDFNDTPISYTIHKMTRDLNDVFREVGRGFSHTYRGFFDMLRIDYVMCSEEFTPISYQVIDSWGVEEKVVRRADTRDTVLVRKYGNGLTPPTEEQALRAGIEVERDTLSGKSLPIYNKVEYSDHYPVVVRLKLNKNKK